MSIFVYLRQLLGGHGAWMRSCREAKDTKKQMRLEIRKATSIQVSQTIFARNVGYLGLNMGDEVRPKIVSICGARR